MLAFVARYRKYVHIFAELPVLELARYQVHRLMKVAPVCDVLTEGRAGNSGALPGDADRSGEEGTGRIFRENKPLLSPDWRSAAARRCWLR